MITTHYSMPGVSMNMIMPASQPASSQPMSVPAPPTYVKPLNLPVAHSIQSEMNRLAAKEVCVHLSCQANGFKCVLSSPLLHATHTLTTAWHPDALQAILNAEAIMNQLLTDH